MSSTSFETLADGVVWRGDGETLVVQAWGRRQPAACARPASAPIVDTDFALLEPAPLAVDDRRSTATSRRCATAGSPPCCGPAGTWTSRSATRCRALHRGVPRRGRRDPAQGAGRGRLAQAQGPRLHRRSSAATTRSRRRSRPNPGEKLYGMGQYQQDILDLKGSTFELAHRNSQASVPFVLSSAGYGFFWHNPAIGRATFAAQPHRVGRRVRASARLLDHRRGHAGRRSRPPTPTRPGTRR